MKKKLFAIGALVCAGVMGLSLTACDTTKESEATSYVTLDINPSIELTLDQENKVISVYGANEDGQVLLYNEEGILNVDVETAVEKITTLAVELGYLDENNTVVETSVSSTKEDLANDILSKVNAKVTVTAGDYELNVACDGNGAYSLQRKLAQLKEKYPDNAAIQALTPAKFKLVLSATETGISVEAAVELDNEELIQLITDAHAQVEEYATSAYNQAKAQASAAYDKAVGSALDGIYTTYYVTHHPMNAYYGYAYQSYKYSARALSATADVIALAEKAGEYPLDEAQIAAAAKALGLGENVDALKNSDGEITVDSIYACADKLFKNSEASAEIEAMKAELDAALDTIESQVQAALEEISVKYEAEITAVKESMETAVNQINATLSLLPESVKTQINAMVTDCRAIVADAEAIIADGKVTSEEVRALAEKLEEKAAATLSSIESDLTEEELAEIKQLQDKATETLTAAKTKMDKAISQAEAQAKEKLEALKAARKAK